MKFTKIAGIATAVLISFSLHAESNEELCSNVADRDVVIKNQFQRDAKELKNLLQLIDESDSKPRNKVRLREKAYWVYNRKEIDDGSFRRLSFLKCITSVQ